MPDTHIHIHIPGDAGDIAARLDRIETAVTASIVQEAMNMSDVSLQITEVQDAVTAQRTVIDSAVAAFGAIRTDLQAVRDELAARGVSDEDLALLDSLSDQVETNTAPLAAAIADSPDGPGEPVEPVEPPAEPTPDTPAEPPFE